MESNAKLTILGTGSNGGIPHLDCKCSTCSLAREKLDERRSRSSIMLEYDGKIILFDASPDIRMQLLNNNASLFGPTAIFISHLHFDHVMGLLEFTVTKRHSKIPVYCHKRVSESLRLLHKDIDSFLEFRHEMHEKINNIEIIAFEVPHTDKNFGQTFGFKVKKEKTQFVYIPDISGYPPNVLETIKNCDFALVDGTFYDRFMYGHISMLETIRILDRLSIPKVYFTHINHSEGSHEFIRAKLSGTKFDVLRDGQIFQL